MIKNIIAFIILTVSIWLLIYWVYYYASHPVSEEVECSRYANKIQSYLPAKCLKYYKN